MPSIKTAYHYGLGEKTDPSLNMLKVERNVVLDIPKPTESKFLTKINDISCRKCKISITTDTFRGSSKYLIQKELPNKDWVDLIDCWSCHKSEFAVLTNKITLAHGDPSIILPTKPGTILTSSSGLYTIGSGVDIQLSETCKNCSHTLAHRLYCVDSSQDSVFHSHSHHSSHSPQNEENISNYTHISLIVSNIIFKSCQTDPSISNFDDESQPLITLGMLIRDLIESMSSQGFTIFTIESHSLKFKILNASSFISMDGSILRPCMIAKVVDGAELTLENAYNLDSNWAKPHIDFFTHSFQAGHSLAHLINMGPLSSIIAFM